MLKNLFTLLSLTALLFSCGSDEYKISEGTLLKVSGGEASSVQERTSFQASYDGDMSTGWQTKWAESGQFPFTAVYTLEDADVLNYILYKPLAGGRSSGFGEIEIWVTTNAQPEFTKVMDFDCEKKSVSTKIEFPEAIIKPTAVKFIIKSGFNEVAGCAEMEFYKNGEPNTLKYFDLPVSQIGYIDPDEYKTNVTGVMKLTYDDYDNPIGKMFFRFTETGKAGIQIKIKNNTASKKLKVSLAGVTKELMLPPINGFQWITIATSDFAPTADYLCLSVENLNKGDIEIESVRVIGDISQTLDYNSHPTNRKNAVSVHLGYQTEDVKDIEWFYNEVTIPKNIDSSHHAFYMVNGWAKGYAGIQMRDKTGKNSKRWLIFSCWNTKETSDEEYWAKVIRTGDNVEVESFGGEGTGAKTYFELDWETEKTYQFLLQSKILTASYVSSDLKKNSYYSLFWKEKGEKDWHFQATIKSPHNPKNLDKLYSFVENYIGENGHLLRKANYGNQWVKNKDGWTEITKAKFTQDGGYKYRKDIGATVFGNSFYLWNGGYIAGENAPDDILTRKSSGETPPVSDNVLKELEIKSAPFIKFTPPVISMDMNEDEYPNKENDFPLNEKGIISG